MFAKQFGLSLDYQKRLAPIDGFVQSANEFFANKHCIGANVTMPFKLDALNWVDELSVQAARAGAVNTIIRQQDKFVGDNTDGIGLVMDLQNHLVNLAGAKVLIIGAGGAAKGALPALIEANIESVCIYNRSIVKADKLVAETNAYTPDKAYTFGSLQTKGSQAMQEFDVIINATSLSLSANLPSLPDSIFNHHPAVYDMVYLSQPTQFLNKAATLGCDTCIDGLGMLVNQAAHSFFLWFGHKPDTQPVYEYLRALNK